MKVAADVRRADWRFVLPDPAPRRVACIGRPEPELYAALELAGAQLQRAGDGLVELLVITSGRPSDVRAARDRLRAGGWVYAELPGRRVRAWEKALREAGFADVAAHWLFPDERSCREIVPLERRALRHALARRDAGGRVRIRARLAAALLEAGAFRFAVRRAAVVGRWCP